MTNDNTTFRKPTQATQNASAMKTWTVGEPPTAAQSQMNGPRTFTSSGVDIQGQKSSFDPIALGELEQSVKDARREKATGEVKISQPGKTRLEILANIGRLTKDVEIGGITFSIRTLKSRETREVALSAFSPSFKNDLEVSYEMRRQQLARSIFKIDGHEIGLVLGNDSFEARMHWIDNDLEESVANKLFAEMQGLNDKARAQFEIKTDEQAKEVAEDLKK